MLNFAARTSVTIASVLLYATMITAVALLETPDESVFTWVVGIAIIWTMAGDLIVQHKQAHPPYSTRVYNGKLDINWGFKYLYWAFWWPKLVSKNS